MPSITLPDGSVKSFTESVTVAEVALAIGKGLAKAAVGGRVDGEMVDLTRVLSQDCRLSIITSRDEDSLEYIRHSTAHLLAHAVKELFPSAQVTIGPVIAEGFYYDFSFERPFTTEDLAAIESKMLELADRAIPLERIIYSREKAIRFFREIGE